MRRTRGPESGETLIEILIAFVILAILTPALIMAMIFTIRASDTFQDAVLPTNNVGLILDDWANAIDKTAYVNCASAPSTSLPASASPPGQYTVLPPTVQYWNGSSFPTTPLTQAQCNSQAVDGITGDQGLQLVTLTVTPTPGAGVPPTQVVKVVKRKPCLSGC